MVRFNENQAGDTIVEVLLAIAILAAILVGAFVTANHSLIAERDAEEHSQALTIAQGQVEDLAAGNQLNSQNCFDTTNPRISTGTENCFVSNNESSNNQFCLSNATIPTPLSDCPSVAQPVGYWYQITDKAILTTTLLSIAANPPVKSTTYEVEVTWPSLAGGTGSVQLYYRPQ